MKLYSLDGIEYEVPEDCCLKNDQVSFATGKTLKVTKLVDVEDIPDFKAPYFTFKGTVSCCNLDKVKAVILMLGED